MRDEHIDPFSTLNVVANPELQDWVDNGSPVAMLNKLAEALCPPGQRDEPGNAYADVRVNDLNTEGHMKPHEWECCFNLVQFMSGYMCEAIHALEGIALQPPQQ